MSDNKTNCDNVRNALLEAQESNRQPDLWVTDHISSCESCALFQGRLAELDSEVSGFLAERSGNFDITEKVMASIASENLKYSDSSRIFPDWKEQFIWALIILILVFVMSLNEGSISISPYIPQFKGIEDLLMLLSNWIKSFQQNSFWADTSMWILTIFPLIVVCVSALKLISNIIKIEPGHFQGKI